MLYIDKLQCVTIVSKWGGGIGGGGGWRWGGLEVGGIGGGGIGVWGGWEVGEWEVEVGVVGIV